jgi:hypothetical protein
MLNMKLLLDLMPGDEEAPLNTPIPLESLPVELSQSFFATGATRNMAQRNLVKLLVVNPESKQPDHLEITEIGYAVYRSQSGKVKTTPQKRTTKADGTPRAVGGRTSNKYDGLRLRKMVDENPRKEGVMGYHSWKLYQDGMTYKEYMACKDFPPAVSSQSNAVFRGPGRNHWDWDLQHGYIALYRDGEEELLPDGSPNPRYWAINNNVN